MNNSKIKFNHIIAFACLALNNVISPNNSASSSARDVLLSQDGPSWFCQAICSAAQYFGLDTEECCGWQEEDTVQVQEVPKLELSPSDVQIFQERQKVGSAKKPRPKFRTNQRPLHVMTKIQEGNESDCEDIVKGTTENQRLMPETEGIQSKTEERSWQQETQH